VRALDSTNPEMLRPSKFASLSACVPLLCVLFAAPIACGAAPDIPFLENPIAVVLSVLGLIFLTMIMVPIVFRWDWKACYYGFSLLYPAGLSLLAITPLLTVVLYGRAPIAGVWVMLILYALTHYFWCRKFVRLYKQVFENDTLRKVIYQEEHDAVYYMRRGDEFLLNKHFKFSQMPPDWSIAIFMILGFAMIPVMGSVTGFLGVPFLHAFLLIAMVPISCMGVGIAVRGYLLFYLFPAKIKKSTGKKVYVDVAGSHNTPRNS
jgi:hypothetical protein